MSSVINRFLIPGVRVKLQIPEKKKKKNQPERGGTDNISKGACGKVCTGTIHFYKWGL